ncbi:MAG: diguanylate cyclase [Clostridiales bacterium]|nr:diguanylate cyclase [Clostridiales bacterium]
MRSIRGKITLLTVCAIVVTTLLVTLISSVAIINIGVGDSDLMLHLLCEIGEKNLDSYFSSVEQSVGVVASYADSDLEGSADADLNSHIDRVRSVFEKAANRTQGVLTYYYRIDPNVSESAKGFWYVDLDGNGFKEHKVTDITLYDVEDTSKLVWFTVPKHTGSSVWLPPYITDNLDVRVISYNVPVFRDDTFIGVIGIEIDYSTVAHQTENIKLYENGYAFILDSKGEIIYHPRINPVGMSDELKSKAPEGLVTGSSDNIFYTYDGVKKQAVRMPLNNGMYLFVSVPTSEINESWRQLTLEILIVSVILLTLFIILTLRLTKRLTKPLRMLTKAAEEVDNGNYDFIPETTGKDEVGILTRTFATLVGHLKKHINDLNDLAYGDALTMVHNKGAFDIYCGNLQTALDNGEKPDFAVMIFDCDDLKSVNDNYGHDKGDAYLKAASSMISHVFKHSAVFRIGGDEFAVLLQNDDLEKRDELIALFEERCAECKESKSKDWETVRVSMGIAVYDPDIDRSVDDVVRRADKEMYTNKWNRKASRDNT